MHARHLDPMIEDLRAQPKKIGEPLLRAWGCKEDLIDLLALHGTHPNRPKINALLVRFYENADASGLPEIARLAGTVSTWWPEIHAAISTGVERRLRGHQPRHQGRRTLRLRLPQPRQPAPPHSLRHHPPHLRTPHDPNQRTPQPAPKQLKTLMT